MKLNKKSLLVACVLAAMSTSAFAASTTTSTTSTTVMNQDTPTSTSTRVTREQHGSTVSTSTKTNTEKSTVESSSMSVSVGAGRVGGYVAVPILSAQHQPPVALKSIQAIIDNDNFIKLGQLATVKQKGKWGVVGTDGKILLEPQYLDIDPSLSADGTYYAYTKKTLEHINIDGSVISSGVDTYGDHDKDILARREMVKNLSNGDVKINSVSYPSDSYTAFSVKNKWGFVDASNKTVIEPQFKEVYTKFSEDRAFVKNTNGKTIAIDGSGNPLFEVPSNDVDEYKNGLAEYRRHISKFNLGGFLSMAVGIGLSSQGGIYYGDAWNPVYDGVKRGYINRSGNIVIDSKNDAVWPMTAYGTLVKNQGKLGFMNRKGNYIIQPGNYDAGEVDNINALLVLINKDNGNAGIFNLETGKQVTPFIYNSINFVSSTRIVATKGENKYLIDMQSGNVVFTTTKDMTIDVFGGSYTWVHKGSSDYQLIDDSGKVLFRDKDKMISKTTPFRHGYSAVKSNGKWGIMNANGEWVVQPMYDEVNVL